MIKMEKNFKNKKIITKTDIINFIISLIGIIVLIIQILEIKAKGGLNNTRFLVYNGIIGMVIVLMNVLSIINKRKELKNEISIKKLEERNKNLLEVSDDVRCFKHDFNNIMQAINGYIDVRDMDALKKYFYSLIKECHHVNIMEMLNYQVLDNPAIYAVLLNKYKVAKESGIEMNLEILINLSTYNEKAYIISRMLGILLDNAIEASIESKEKIINVRFVKKINENKSSIIIENTYNDKDIDLDKIFEKNYSTKKAKRNSGLGLWKIKNIISKDKKLNLITTKDDEMFRQELELSE